MNQLCGPNVTLGMSTSDVMHLFQPALDQWKDSSGILYNSVAEGGRYLLIFSPPDKDDKQGRKLDKLVEIFYRPGGKTEAMYLLPHKKRGQAVPPKYREVMGERGK